MRAVPRRGNARHDQLPLACGDVHAGRPREGAEADPREDRQGEAEDPRDPATPAADAEGARVPARQVPDGHMQRGGRGGRQQRADPALRAVPVFTVAPGEQQGDT